MIFRPGTRQARSGGVERASRLGSPLCRRTFILPPSERAVWRASEATRNVATEAGKLGAPGGVERSAVATEPRPAKGPACGPVLAHGIARGPDGSREPSVSLLTQRKRVLRLFEGAQKFLPNERGRGDGPHPPTRRGRARLTRARNRRPASARSGCVERARARARRQEAQGPAVGHPGSG